MRNQFIARICSKCHVRFRESKYILSMLPAHSVTMCEGCKKESIRYSSTRSSRTNRLSRDERSSYQVESEMASDSFTSDYEIESFRLPIREIYDAELSDFPLADAEVEHWGEDEVSSYGSRSKVFSLKNDNETRERLAQYTLFAFVLYDPDVHMDIYQTLQKRYQMLDEDTGSDLLFFSFVKPSKKWLRDRMKKYPNRKSIWQSAAESDHHSTISNVYEHEYTDPSVIISLVSQQLSISQSQLPCIVITTSLHEKHPINIIQFDTKDVVRKLIKLGEIASGLRRLPSRLISDVDNIAGIISKELTTTFEEQVIRSEIDDISTNLLEIMDISEYNDESNVRERLDRYLAAINKIREKIAFLAESNQFIQYNVFSHLARIDGYCTYLWKLLATSAQFDLHDASESTAQELLLPVDGLEEESSVFLRTQHQIMRLYEQLYDDDESIDYSPLMISLTKIIELEINMSVVHVLRILKGVEVPKYFNAYQPNVEATYQTKNRTIDFNRPDRTRTQLILPGMGESYAVTTGDINIRVRDTMYEMIRQHHGMSKPKWDREFKKFIEYWSKLYPMRNVVAHAQRVDRTDYDSLIELMTAIRDVMPYLITIKSRLRGVEPDADEIAEEVDVE